MSDNTILRYWLDQALNHGPLNSEDYQSAKKALIETTLTEQPVESPTHEQLMRGARAIGNSMREDNHYQRTKEVWDAFHTDKEVPIPRANYKCEPVPESNKVNITGEMVKRGAIACSQWRDGKKMPFPTWNGLPELLQQEYADQALSCLVAALTKPTSIEGQS